jgi:hypothetical protein
VPGEQNDTALRGGHARQLHGLLLREQVLGLWWGVDEEEGGRGEKEDERWEKRKVRAELDKVK